jgi:hypothetical protein
MMNSLKTSLAACAVLIAAICGLATPGYCQTAWLEKPLAHASPDKDWWETDYDQYKAFSDLCNAEPDMVLHGETQTSGAAISIKPGTVVEIRFPEMYQIPPYTTDTDAWRFSGKSGVALGMMAIDFQNKFENGRVLLHEPGSRIFKFKVAEKGDLIMNFKFGKYADLQAGKPASKELSITFKVQ